MVQIRIATKADVAAIAELHTRSWRLAYKGMLSDQYLLHELDHDRLVHWQKRFAEPEPDQYVIVAEDDKQPTNLLGFACAFGHYDAEAGTLVDNLHAHPDHKKSGIGRLLLSEVARWSLNRYPDDLIHLWVVAQNSAAIGFYKHMGAIEDRQSIWDAPGGTQLPEFRFTWYNPSQLI